MNKAPVKFILGEAGTAKTTYLIKIVEELSKSRKIACLAFTHSAVNNMRTRTKALNVVFKTIHSFLGIIPNSSGYIRNKRCCENALAFDVIIIDEFTLIPLDIFNLLISETVGKVDKIIVAGDLLQLPPPDSYEFVNEELFKDVEPLSGSGNRRFPFNSFETDILTAIKIAKHLSQTAFNSDYFKNSDKMILKKNFRNGSNVMRILNDALENNFDIIEDGKRFENIIKLINDGYIVIGSKYYLLKKISTKCQTSKMDMKKLKCSSDSLPSPIGLIDSTKEVYLTENIDANFSNGDIVKILKINDEEDALASRDEVAIEIIKEDSKITTKLKLNSEGVYPVMPLNFYTVHKAQGKTFEKIIVILDDMFELSMLYTAITRAKEDVKFVCFNKEKAFKEIREQNKAFNLLKQIVYV